MFVYLFDHLCLHDVSVCLSMSVFGGVGRASFVSLCVCVCLIMCVFMIRKKSTAALGCCLDLLIYYDLLALFGVYAGIIFVLILQFVGFCWL